MIFAVFALVTLAALAVLLYPLLTAAAPAAARADYDLAVYRAQLLEVDADTERGVLAPNSARDVSLEIQRRMLNAAAAPIAIATNDPSSRKIAVIVLALMLPLVAGLLYASYGHPELPGRPYAWRAEHDPAVILAIAAADMEQQLAAKPSARGYQSLADLYVKMRDYPRAATAQKRAILAGANTAADWAMLGEIYVLAQNGVGPEALAAIAEALTLDPREPRARFYAGVAAFQIGHFKGAVAIWRDLAAASKPDAPWLPDLRRGIAEAARLGKFDPESIAPAPPSAAALASAVRAMTKARP